MSELATAQLLTSINNTNKYPLQNKGMDNKMEEKQNRNGT